MFKQLHFKSLLLALIMLIGGSSLVSAADVEIATGTFNGKDGVYTDGWSTTGTGKGRTDCIIIGSGENITSPTFDLSGYTSVSITFTGRRYGNLSGSKATVDAAIGGVSKGTIDITGTSVSAVSGSITFEPTSSMTAVQIVFTCTNATSPGSTHGAGIGSITIKGTPAGSQPTTWTVTYDANGGTGTMSDANSPYNSGATVTVLDNTFTRVNYTFAKWNTADDGTGTDYDEGATFTINANTTLYAQWTENSGVNTGTTETLTIGTNGNCTWTNGEKTNQATVGNVTFDALGSGGNDGKYYSSDNSWRFYTANSSGLKVSVPENNKITKIVVTWKTGQPITPEGFSASGTTSPTTYTANDTTSVNEVYFYRNTANVLFQILAVTYEPTTSSTDPSISADDVDLDYDATSGSITYSITNEPDPTGTMVALTESDWLTLNGTNFTCSANTSALARTATVTLTYTYGDNQTVTANVTVTQAGDPNAVMTIAEVRAQGTGNVETKGVVTSCVGTTAYIQDATAAICVYGAELTVGDEIKVKGTLDTYNGLLEIKDPEYTVLSQNNTINPEVMTIAQVLESNKQGWLVRIENATVQSLGQNTVVAQGENTIIVRGIGDDVEIDDIISVTGNIGSFNNVQIVNPTNLVVQTPTAIEYYITGSFNSWSQDTNKMQKLTKNNDGKYDADITFDSTTTFKVIRKELNGNLTWLGATANGNFVINRNSGSINLVDGSDFEIAAGEYTFTVEHSNNSATLTVTGWPAPKYYIEGSWTQDWDEGMVELTENTDGTFGCTMEVGDGTRFKFVKSEDNVLIRYGANQSDDYYVHSEWCTDIAVFDYGTAPFRIQTSGSCTLTFTLNVTDMMFSVTGWPVVLSGDRFVKVTSTDDITSGQYLIVYEDVSVAFDGSLATLDAANNTIDVDINDGVIAATAENRAATFTIDVAEGTLKSASGYYLGVSSNSNGLSQNVNASTYTNTFSIDSDDNAVITAVFEGSTMTLRYNYASNQARFRYYKSGQQAIQLYKYVPETENVAITAAGMATYYSENPLDFTGFEDMWAYTAAVTSDGAITYTRINKVPARTAVVLYNQNNTSASHEVPVCTETPETVGTNNLIGVLEYYYVPETETNGATNYLLNNGSNGVGFYKANGQFGVAAHRAYLQVPAGTPGTSVRSFYGFNEGGVSTGIEELNSESMTDNRYYNLNGQQMAAPQKGLYIVNGKKVMVK